VIRRTLTIGSVAFTAALIASMRSAGQVGHLVRIRPVCADIWSCRASHMGRNVKTHNSFQIT
jgi:hypothetical protein